MSLQTLVLWFWGNSAPNGYEVVPHYGSDLCFSNEHDSECFYNAYWTFLYHLWRNVYSSLLPVFELDFVIVVVGVDLLNSIYSKRFWRLKSSKEAWANTQWVQCTGNCWGAWGFLVVSYGLFIDYVIYTFLHQSDCVPALPFGVSMFVYKNFSFQLGVLIRFFWGKPEDPVFSVMHKGNSYKLWWRSERLVYRWRIETSLYGVHSGKCIAPCSFLLIELSKIFWWSFSVEARLSRSLK